MTRNFESAITKGKNQMEHLEQLDNRSLVLDIAVNLGRIGKFSMMGNEKRVRQFLLEVEEYFKVVNNRKIAGVVDRPLKRLEQICSKGLPVSGQFNRENIDDLFTYANILTHRAELA